MTELGCSCNNTIVAIDFDGTITKGDLYPEIGEIREHAKEIINGLQKRRCCVIIFTCREKKEAEMAREWLKKQGIIFNHFNQNCERRIQKYGCSARKIGADIYIDDRSIGFLTKSIDWLEIGEQITEYLDFKERSE